MIDGLVLEYLYFKHHMDIMSNKNIVNLGYLKREFYDVDSKAS